MDSTQRIIIGIVAVFLLFVAFSAGKSGMLGSAPSGLVATERANATTEVGPDIAVSIFSASNCSSRVISTSDGAGQPIYFTLSNINGRALGSSTVAVSTGHYQAASTTVVYDGGTYGCGEWMAVAEASTTLALSEF